MNCASCGHTNPIGSRFCSGCGSSLAPRCPACDIECAVGARFCNGCGAAMVAPFAQPIADAVSRKIVTIVFADLIGSVSLHERLDAESARRLMDRYHRAMSAAVDVHGGRVVQLLGDGVLAAFGMPRVAEDDAIRAVRAAVGMQRTFRELAREQGAAMEGVGLRVAVNTGEIIVSDDENSVMGDPTNVAARLQQEARDGDVIVGEGTQRLVADLVTLTPLGAFALRGRAESVAAYRVVSLDRPAASRQATAFVGRDEELRRLIAVYDAAVATPSARLVVLLGSPGLGKSRLVAEFTRRAGERATVLSARCDADGGATFAPLAAALRALLHIEEGAGGDVLRAAVDAVVSGDDAERTRIAAGIGALLAGEPAPPEETFFVVRRLLAALATVRPVVLVIDDLHWAEPLLLDLVEHLVQWSSGVPLLVLVAARPELRDARSSLATPGSVVTDVVALSGLDAGAATRLAANVIGGSELPAALAGRVLATSEGNPLFVSELVRMLVQDGTLVREGDRWVTTVEVSKLDMPATIQVLLAARIERLRPEDRSVLERAAVIGRHFSRAAVAQLLPRGAGDLDARLEALRRSELIEPDTGWFLGEPALRFHHVLIRDAAYRRVLKETRAELHERLADWIVARAGESVEHDETIGWHFEQAHQNLRELGALDAHGASLGERAAHHLGAAGRRALAREDLALAAGLLGRALDRLAPADPARAELALEWCEALLAGGDVAPAARAIDELAIHVSDSDRLRAWHTCFVGQLAVLTDPQSLRATADTIARAAEALAVAGDAAGEAKAHSVHATALSRLGEVGACETALDKALAAARRARDRRRANAVLAGAPVAALWGPSPVTRASGRCLDVVRVLRITQGAPAVEAVALRCQAVLETLRGRGEAARRMIASSRRMVEELGIAQQLFEADVFAGHIELLEGDAEAAERFLRSAYDGLRERGLGIDAARAAALLGRALLAQHRATEAEALSHESEALAGDDLKAAIAWRGVRAEALARRGESATAVELARAAVAIAAATDALLDHADARQALSVALRAADQNADADAEETRAIELWEAKGATLLVERAQRGATKLGSSARADAADATSAHAVRRRVTPNAATRSAAHLDAAFRSGDAAAVSAAIGDEMTVLHHPTGTEFGREGALGRFHALLRAEDPILQHEPIATLGDALALCHQFTSVTALADDDIAPAGASRTEVAVLIEAGDGGPRRVEIFAEDHLADAVMRLYERYAELLPEGPERERAADTARSIASMIAPPDIDRWGSVFAPEIEWVDSRNVGTGSIRGADAVLASIRALLDLASEFTNQTQDVLCVRPDGLLVRWTNSGTLRAGGGEFERDLCQLWLFGADGRLIRWEQFDADRAADALARFDELAEPQAPVRRVRANAATAVVDQMSTVHAARDLGGLAQILADDITVVHHPTVVEFGRDAALSRFESLYRADDFAQVNEPLATLGDALALLHTSTSAGALADDDIDAPFGAIRIDTHVVTEVDARGKQRRVEIFADDHLANAIVRLYERYAELLPEGGEREKAGTTANALAQLLGLGDPDVRAEFVASDHAFVDHRLLGFPSSHDREATRAFQQILHDIASDITVRVDALFEARPDAVLFCSVTSGTDRSSGGRYEREVLQLRIFGADGRIQRTEWFDADRVADAIARFDALTAPHSAVRRVRRNAASASGDRFHAAAAARDLDAIAALIADDFQLLHHPTAAQIDRDGGMKRWQMLLRAEGLQLSVEPIATLGDSLELVYAVTSFASLTQDELSFGASRSRYCTVSEVNERGQAVRIEVFADDHLGDAVVRLYECYAEQQSEGPARERAAMIARAVAAFLPADFDAIAAVIAPDIEVVDRRTLGFGSTRGAENYLRALRSLDEVARDRTARTDDVLGLRTDAVLVRRTTPGTDRAGGGAFEKQFLQLLDFGSAGRVTRSELFDAERVDAALARFDALTDPAPPTTRFANAASRAKDRMSEAWRARDFDRYAALFPPHHRTIDNRRLMHVELGRDELLAGFRPIFETGARFDVEIALLATRGERLALFRERVTGEVAEVGPSEVEYLQIIGVDERGELTIGVVFDPDDLAAAYTELDVRYAAGEAVTERRAAITRAFSNAFAARDWDALAALLAPDLVAQDHRLLGWETLHGPAAYVQALHSLIDLAPDTQLRLDHVSIAAPRFLYVATWIGTRDGGVFEMPSVIVSELDADGRIRRFDQYDIDRLEEIRARFEETRPDPLRIPQNAAMRAMDRFGAAVDARDWDGLANLLAPEFSYEDRRRGIQDSGDRGKMLASIRHASESGANVIVATLATAGERLVLQRLAFSGSEADRVVWEIDTLQLVEIDAEGCWLATVSFDPDDLRAASLEMQDRYFRGEGARFTPASTIEFVRAVNDCDAARARAALPDDFVFYDHRRTGVGRIENADDYVASLAALWELSPDVATDTLYHVAVAEHGSLHIGRMFGTLAEGGAFESIFVRLSRYENGRNVETELFELEDFERARALFEARRRDPLRIPPNAATRGG